MIDDDKGEWIDVYDGGGGELVFWRFIIVERWEKFINGRVI